jgi:hypothetical protein
MKLRTACLFLMTLVLAIAVPAAAMPGSNDPGKDPGRKTCDPAELAAVHDAVMMACPCDTATSHGQFVSCAGRVLRDAAKGGTLSRPCRQLARRGVAKSSCGKPGFVTCCRSRGSAAAKCSVKRDPASCVAAGGCVGSTATCLDACASPCGSPGGALLDTPALF